MERMSSEQFRRLKGVDRQPHVERVLNRNVRRSPKILPSGPTAETRDRRYVARPLESEVQAQIVAELRLAGYEVLITSQRKRKPPASLTPQERNAWYATGTSKGISDLLVSHDDWGALWLAVEIKRDEHEVRNGCTQEQDALRKRGKLYVVCDVREALDAIQGAGKIFQKEKESE